MSKITSKFQVTVPKLIAEQYGLRPGDEIDWVPAGETIRVVPRREKRPSNDLARRLKSFEAATVRQKARNALQTTGRRSKSRGWRREDLYVRGRPR